MSLNRVIIKLLSLREKVISENDIPSPNLMVSLSVFPLLSSSIVSRPSPTL